MNKEKEIDMLKEKLDYYTSVSYTHLDVYKRQVRYYSAGKL